MTSPVAVLAATAILFGVTALVYGVAAIVASLRLRSLVKNATVRV